MAKSIRVIPATISMYSQTPLMELKKRRVAAYARVSTDREDQTNSYEAQVSYYTDYIKGRDDWEFVAVYADEGISGCATKGRKGFNSMIADALAGKIEIPTFYMIQNTHLKHCKYAKNRAFSAKNS